MKHCNAFTLLEILVTVTLGSMILVLLSGSAWVVRRDAQRMNGTVNVSAWTDSTRLARLLTGVLPASANPRFSFRVGSRRENLLSSVIALGGRSGMPGHGDIAVLELSFHPGEGLLAELDRGFFTAFKDRFRLFKGARDFKIKCLDDEGNWYDRWPPSNNKTIPVAVEIRVLYFRKSRNPVLTRTILLPTGADRR